MVASNVHSKAEMYQPRAAVPQAIGTILDAVLASYGIRAENLQTDGHITTATAKKPAKAPKQQQWRQTLLF